MMTCPGEVHEFLKTTPAAAQWQRIGMSHHHGIDVALFSLRSQQSCGIGEFLDLCPLIDWCQDVGFDLLQLLPLNDTGNDASPYNAQTAFGLNPIHLSLAALPGWQEDPLCGDLIAQLQTANKLKRVDYERIRPLRADFLKRYYALMIESIRSDSNYQNFLERHHYWLPFYSLFKALKEQDSRYWKQWKKAWREGATELYQEFKEAIEFHCFVQYLCFSQMSHVRRYAEAAGVWLKGDIPILISPDSAEAWHFQQYFDMDYGAGAPPDMYAPKGQSWGFPLYDWEALKADHYAWWLQRLRAAEECYHLYRLDHILGFFRIWAIPRGRAATEGHYEPKDEALWLPQGETILRALLQGSSMLPIGEDLGVVPDGVRSCLKQLGIPGTKVTRWERAWDEDGHFLRPQDYSPISMTTISTHDSETLSQWWAQLPKEARVYAQEKQWPYDEQLSHSQRFEILAESHASGSLFHVNLLQEYLALVPDLVWPKADDERINVPGKISKGNWSYRYRISVEELNEHDILKQELKLLLPR